VLRIRDVITRIPDPGVKKAPDPGSATATNSIFSGSRVETALDPVSESATLVFWDFVLHFFVAAILGLDYCMKNFTGANELKTIYYQHRSVDQECSILLSE
jgi:hypothetical protein